MNTHKMSRCLLATVLGLALLSGASADGPVGTSNYDINDWHSAVERYPLQLHELERNE